MAAVSLLEVNWVSVQEIFELVNRVPNNDVKKLAQAEGGGSKQ
jgi:hypothetical protein